MTHAIVSYSEHFAELAVNELRREHPDLTSLTHLSPQHLLFSVPCSFGDLLRPFQARLPVYLHHLFPVQRTLALTNTFSDFTLMREAARSLCSDPFSVQAHVVGDYRYSAVSIEQTIIPGQPRIHANQPKGRVLSILVVDQCCYMGVSWVSRYLSAFMDGSVYFDEATPNRAGLKLIESLAAFDIRLRTGDHALDLGAAPGAWTGILRRRGVRVTAVAPLPMYDWLLADPDVRAFQMTAGDYLLRCDTTYDLIVNDMKMDAQDSARMMVEYAPTLRSQGIAIMTLKLRMRNPRRVIDHALRLLRKEYKIIRMRQLVSNRKELTLFLRRKV